MISASFTYDGGHSSDRYVEKLETAEARGLDVEMVEQVEPLLTHP
jgi:hypothetical protein